MKEKSVIRKTVMKRRDAMSEEECTRLSRSVCEKVMRLPGYEKARVIYTYVSFGREADTKNLIRDAWRHGKKVAVPKIHGDDLEFYYIESFGQLQEGYKGIPEPSGCRKAEDEEAFVIMPGVAFDEQRNRLGYGKGYYDRFLEKNPKHKTAAMAFDFQVQEKELPHEKTDLKPDVIVTEKRIIK
ncbi:MAG: 5-formyltetrahydrofolate cyclo-ligase [Lachnospiraceae bacterium]|jgi:5-formyltetrahydrofolate cyclo-ligase|nr:5-formyltetrahydrofolate cyclo-ligase [Lachnospiraceae bacterium]